MPFRLALQPAIATLPAAARRLAPVLMLCMAGSLPALAAGPANEPALWPCIQPRVDTLAVGQMWSGPSLEGLAWRDDQGVTDLVPVLAARRTPIEEATAKIEEFAKSAGADKNKRLTLLFAGVFDEINTLRARVLAGIGRYAQHQVDLANRIKEEGLQLSQAQKPDAKPEDKAKAADLEKQVQWDTRIYDARNQAVNAVCESPVILEQRAFSIARAIQNVMD